MRAHHPIHAMLVHLPLGLLPTVALVDIVALATHDAFWWGLSFWVLTAGLVGALAAITTGLIDYMSLPEKVAKVGMKHMMLMGTGASIFLISLLLRVAAPSFTPWLLLLIDGVGAGFLFVGAFFGGELVYRYGIGQIEATNERQSSPSRGRQYSAR